VKLDSSTLISCCHLSYVSFIQGPDAVLFQILPRVVPPFVFHPMGIGDEISLLF